MKDIKDEKGNIFEKTIFMKVKVLVMFYLKNQKMPKKLKMN